MFKVELGVVGEFLAYFGKGLPAHQQVVIEHLQALCLRL